MKFHRLQPAYVHSRIKALQRAFRTFVLCHCDVEDPVNPLAQVSKAAIDHHCTLLVAFSDVECARYLELLKAYESKPADSLAPRIETEHSARRVFAVLQSRPHSQCCVLHPTLKLLCVHITTCHDKVCWTSETAINGVLHSIAQTS